MYLSADDARSDFFLAGAVYVIGPALVSLLADALPRLFTNTIGAWILTITVQFLLIAGMPLFLMRYREESFAGLATGGVGSLVLGFGIAAVFTAALVIGEVLGGGRFEVLTSGLVGLRQIVGIVLRWVSLAILALFLYRRAEYAFRPISEPQQSLVRRAGIACVGVIVVATVLLLLADRPWVSLIPAAGLAGMFLLAEQQLPQSGVGERWWVWAPLIVLALGPLEIFSFLFAGESFLGSARQGAIAALFGLVTGMAQYNRRGGQVAFGMAGAFMIANLLVAAGGTRFVL